MAPGAAQAAPRVHHEEIARVSGQFTIQKKRGPSHGRRGENSTASRRLAARQVATRWILAKAPFPLQSSRHDCHTRAPPLTSPKNTPKKRRNPHNIPLSSRADNRNSLATTHPPTLHSSGSFFFLLEFFSQHPKNIADYEFATILQTTDLLRRECSTAAD